MVDLKQVAAKVVRKGIHHRHTLRKLVWTLKCMDGYKELAQEQ